MIDDRYLFNRHFSKAFVDSGKEKDLSAWTIKVICGFAGSVDIELDPNAPNVPETDRLPSRLYTITLVSRINQRRLGTRYVRRGLDFDGNAANNVEMEQIVFHHDFIKYKAISSHVQWRGSAPAIWGQELDLSYKPKLLIADISRPDIWTAIEKHYKDLAGQYVTEGNAKDDGKIICVNLLDTAKFEGPLTETYEETVKRAQNEKIEYEGEL